MTLVAQSLADKITSELGSDVGTVSYLKSIKDYIETNIVITATYTGMTTTTPPVKDPAVPANIKCVLNPAMPAGTIIKPFLMSLKSPDPSSFLTGVLMEMNPIQFLSTTPVIFTTPVIYVEKPMTSDLERLKNAKDWKECWLIFCEHIIDSVLTFTPSTPAIPSTSITPGSGVTTITSVK